MENDGGQSILRQNRKYSSYPTNQRSLLFHNRTSLHGSKVHTKLKQATPYAGNTFGHMALSKISYCCMTPRLFCCMLYPRPCDQEPKKKKKKKHPVIQTFQLCNQEQFHDLFIFPFALIHDTAVKENSLLLVVALQPRLVDQELV